MSDQNKLMPEMDELDALDRLRFGDHEAFKLIYKRYHPDIAKRILFLIKDTFLAEDLTQQVFMKIWELRERLAHVDSFKFFLYRMAKNMVVDFYRKAANDQNLVEQLLYSAQHFSNTTQEDIFYKEYQQIIETAIEKLPKQQKEVFKLCKMQGFSYKEVSDRLGISTSTISNHMVQATKTLRSKINIDQLVLILMLVRQF